MSKYSMSIKYGVIAGIIMIVIILLVYFVNVNALAGMWPRVAYIPLVFLMIWGGITARRELGNFSGFGHAFLTVFIISFTASMLFDSFNYVLFTSIDPQIPVIIKRKSIEDVKEISEKLGLSDEKTDAAVKDLESRDFTPNVQSQMIKYASSIVIGGVLSLIIGLFVNRPDVRPLEKAGE